MTDQPKAAEGVPLPEGTLVLAIIVTPQGQCSVNGPIDAPLVAYGMLELGRQTIEEYVKRKHREGNLIQMARADRLSRLPPPNGKPVP